LPLAIQAKISFSFFLTAGHEDADAEEPEEPEDLELDEELLSLSGDEDYDDEELQSLDSFYSGKRGDKCHRCMILWYCGGTPTFRVPTIHTACVLEP